MNGTLRPMRGPNAPVPAYFGPTLCRPCAQAAADYYDQAGRWPPLPPDWQGPPLPSDWQAELDALHHEPCPVDVIPTDTHPWVPCTECGRGCLVSLTRSNGKPRKVWPVCRMTPGCPGRHDPSSTASRRRQRDRGHRSGFLSAVPHGGSFSPLSIYEATGAIYEATGGSMTDHRADLEGGVFL